MEIELQVETRYLKPQYTAKLSMQLYAVTVGGTNEMQSSD